MATLKAEGLYKSYRGRAIVSDANLEVAKGEIVGLLGPNGAGKTTCFYMVVGLVKADAGSITLNQADLTELPIHARAKAGIGYLPQEPSVFRKLSVADNLNAILQLRSDLSRAERKSAAEELLEDFGVNHVRDSMGISLSGGERRRVEIARALAANPQFILLDEPFAGVDPISVGDIQRIVRRLADRGIGVLITDHNVRETLGIVQRAYILSDGRVLAAGNAQEILADPKVREVYLGEDFSL
ncbi:lipopolysaccharide ABC transporter [Halorhodospira halochloris]|uniref:Lipopolysaccharide export system ATP-binding protein LptB n=1 Tax=Halorhodospira halochloris TaxID=1052 RepID=A0A0X8XAP4_HALHR|nr:LPS export ABC transporter ATP-binding protein [Halorhodospira halochloris]MBK1651682.1 LPS export ABC transporter ATP-binding protein [Halorhodospira halochloris]MCG5548117.1 LPS export ABC transporter ATP-binding protein [Halorhodospira halochloris]BAU58546.1 lipopolysaccharide ABC transporter [Halorhodospira halochloris]